MRSARDVKWIPSLNQIWGLDFAGVLVLAPQGRGEVGVFNSIEAASPIVVVSLLDNGDEDKEQQRQDGGECSSGGQARNLASCLAPNGFLATARAKEQHTV